MNTHKWFLTNFDCSPLWVKASEANMVLDFKDWQIPLGRRFRSLKLWMVLRLYGLENLQCYIRNHIKLAKHFEDLVAADSRFEIVVPCVFALDLLDSVNSTGKIFISHTVLSGKYILRFVVGAPLTEENHIISAWKIFQDQTTLLLRTN
ncbi:hypothetical protein MKX01_007231 [Papaver californicum]|nr:hypothetical protein MKX01_007231 [Papaver californicum]